MQEDDRKINSWWQSSWAGSYVRSIFLGAVFFFGSWFIPKMPFYGRVLLSVIGLVLAVASYFAARSRWRKI